jgi:hypothetical protein
MPGYPFPTLNNSGTTRITNNVFFAERDSPYYRRLSSGVNAGQTARNSVVEWSGFTSAELTRNIFVVNATDAPSRMAWFNGKPCASDPKITIASNQAASDPRCTWDLADNFDSTGASDNIYFNATGTTTLSSSFPGSCASTPLGACKANSVGGRSEYNHGCACASLSQWLAQGEDKGSLAIDPKLEGPLRLVTSPVAIALGIEPLHQLATVGPDWQLPLKTDGS